MSRENVYLRVVHVRHLPPGVLLGRRPDTHGRGGANERTRDNMADAALAGCSAAAMASFSSPERRRRRVLDEIVATERAHVATLEAVAACYIRPARARGVLAPDDVAALFSTWEVRS